MDIRCFIVGSLRDMECQAKIRKACENHREPRSFLLCGRNDLRTNYTGPKACVVVFTRGYIVVIEKFEELFWNFPQTFVKETIMHETKAVKVHDFYYKRIFDRKRVVASKKLAWSKVTGELWR